MGKPLEGNLSRIGSHLYESLLNPNGIPTQSPRLSRCDRDYLGSPPSKHFNRNAVVARI
jgi:hypothetical protein